MTDRILAIVSLLFLLLCIPFTGLAASPPLILRSTSDSAPLTGHMDILEDPSGQLTITEVSSPGVSRLFRPDREAAPRTGYRNCFYWLRFTIASELTASQSRLLELDMPYIRSLDLYLPKEGGGFDLMQAGSERPLSIRQFKHRNPVFPMVVYEKGNTYYLRLNGTRRAVLPLTVWSPEAFGAMDSHRALFAGGYFGAMLVMIVYNLFIFISLRDRSYLYYILDIFFFALFVFYHKGYLIEFATNWTPSINRHAFLLSVPAVLTGCAFCRVFLDTRRTIPVIDRILTLYMIVTALCIPAALVVPTALMIRAVSIISFFSIVLGTSAGVVCLLRGFRPARYYVGARIVRSLGTLSFALAINNILPWNMLTLYGMQIGSICEVLFLSFALADRISVMRTEKEQAQADAIRASHLAALGELAAGVAHEINTPVNTIINSVDLLLEESDRKSIEHDAEVIKAQGRRISTIAKSLLFFSRKPEQEKEPFDVSALLHGTFDMIGSRMRKEKVAITVQSPPGLLEVLVRPQQIEQVFLNILTNALHALYERHGDTEGCKTLEISISQVVVNTHQFVRIEFLDNGIGIPAFLIDNVKESFVTTKKSGTGLGLSISQQIVAEHGGVIGIESREVEFTKVSIDLPAVITA